MKRWLILIATCITTTLFATSMQNRELDQENVRELISALGSDKDVDIIEETQNKWIRSKSKERWQVAELSANKKTIVMDWAKSQGLYDPWLPAETSYDKAVILGATTGHMKMRLIYLKKLWSQGIRFKEVVWLTGDRPLDSQIDHLCEIVTNESEAAHILWMKTELPDEMKSLPVRFVATQMKTSHGELKRPNTMDTLITWLKTTDPCKALFVSTQPFCGYQSATIKAALPEEFEFDVVAEAADPTSHPAVAAITLDSVARWLYQENLHRNQS